MVQELLTSNIVVMLFLAERKIGATFTDTQFRVNDFHFWRADMTLHGGGLVAYARSDLAYDGKLSIESICTELSINNKKWLISGICRPPSLSKTEVNKDFIKTFGKTTTKYDNFLLLGDLNYDTGMLVEEKCTLLTEMCSALGLI